MDGEIVQPPDGKMSNFCKHGHRGEEMASPSSHGPWNRIWNMHSSVSRAKMPAGGMATPRNPRSR